MADAIHMQYRKMPPLFFLRAPLYAFWGRSKFFRGKGMIVPA
jgi:hypothetical protein